MTEKIYLVVTSINPPNDILKSIAAGCVEHQTPFILIGDSSSPSDFRLEGCDYYSIGDQKETGLEFASLCPERHYSRKNIGYLLAMKSGADIIVETDDDNIPSGKFWEPKKRIHEGSVINGSGWVNAYSYFTDKVSWPRGFPLELIMKSSDSGDYSRPALPPEGIAGKADCPIQQFLADENPDVDAVYRLTRELPLFFNEDVSVALGKGSWCPFNSQNTVFYKEAFPLLYLPSYCSFRMTDIWRSFVAQRIAWENNWGVLFASPTVIQKRNDHSLLRDFNQEISGYLNNALLCKKLEDLVLKPGTGNIAENMIRCYEVFIEMKLIDEKEMPLLQAWLKEF